MNCLISLAAKLRLVGAVQFRLAALVFDGKGLLAATGPQCPVDGAAMDHLDDAVAAAVEAGLLQGRVEVCVENADLDVLGRIGALLRY